MISEDQLILAYLAGVIDSDGSISIALNRWRASAKNLSPIYAESVDVGMCDIQAIKLFQERFGGYIRTEKARGEKRRPMYYWSATNRNAIAVITALLPYLRIKRHQADVCLELRSLKDRGREANTIIEERTSLRNTRWGQRTYRRRLTSPIVLAEYHALMLKIRSLNDSRFPVALPILPNGETVKVVP